MLHDVVPEDGRFLVLSAVQKGGIPQTAPKQSVLRPVLHSDPGHFVLVVVRRGTAVVYDSLPSYTAPQRDAAVTAVLGNIPFKVKSTAPQTSNSCAFMVFNTVCRLVGQPYVGWREVRNHFTDLLIRKRNARINVLEAQVADLRLDVLLEANEQRHRDSGVLSSIATRQTTQPEVTTPATTKPQAPQPSPRAQQSRPTAVPAPATTGAAKSALSPLAAPFVPTTPKVRSPGPELPTLTPTKADTTTRPTQSSLKAPSGRCEGTDRFTQH